MGTTNGRINKAEAVASITGATSTGFELHSWFTAQTGMDVNGVHYGAGEDVPIQTVKDASTDGSISTANLMEKVDAHYINPTIAIGTTQTDLIAATLRYNFVVPEDAKAKHSALPLLPFPVQATECLTKPLITKSPRWT